MHLCVAWVWQACAPLWSQECGTSMFSTGICASVSDNLEPRETIAPTAQSNHTFTHTHTDQHTHTRGGKKTQAAEACVNQPNTASVNLLMWQSARHSWTSLSSWMVQTASTPGPKSRTSSATSSASSTSAWTRCR